VAKKGHGGKPFDASFFPSIQNKTGFVFSGRSIQIHSESVIDFPFDKSLYADDKSIMIDTRMDLENGMQKINHVFKRFGLTRTNLSCGA
jgi:hypothetical protein